MKNLLATIMALAPGPLMNARAAEPRAAESGEPATYDVAWNTPSDDASGSMPLGNGDIGVNAWVEKSGDLAFYISKTDSWDDNGRLLKVGRVRMRLKPNPLPSSATFRQTLSLTDATINVRYGEGDAAVDCRVWVDANHPVIYAECNGARPFEAEASIELWRTERFVLPSIEVSDVMTDRSKPGGQHEPTVVEPDTVLTDQAGRIGWYHRNVKSVGPSLTAKIQGLTDFDRPDPLLDRAFGAVIKASNGQRLDDLRLQSPPSTKHCFSVYVATHHPATPQQWLQAMDETIAATERIPLGQRREAHERWWQAFWDRSWIHVTSSAEAKERPPAPANAQPIAERDVAESDDAFVVSRGYALQRFINACAGRGRYPIKFNGSIFTVPYPGGPGDADYRRWGPGYWWQNTRLPYISMCASGDFDLMQPLFRMYARDLMPLFRYRTRRYLGHDGVFIPECIYFWGDVFTETYGWTPFEQREDKLQKSGWHKWEWVSGPELVFMMLDYYDYTRDESFLRETALPAAHEVLTFFDQRYRTDEAGKLLMHPSQACETWWDCTNPMPELAGLHAVVDRLTSLPERLTPADQRAFWSALKKKLPDLPTREVDGKRMLAPAAKFAQKSNIENPELYAVFPFRLIGVGRPRIELGVEALNHRWDKGNSGWRQDDIFMAYLGLAGQARENLVGRARNKHEGSRFPAFWGPNYDWIPDQDHGSVLLKTLQAMILQTDGDKIYLLPAWPKDWNADFKLRAPYKTLVRGAVKDGKLARLEVLPESRRKDVIVMQAQ
ncbi:MAG TPA: DUF5703 domain-containing protein [Sumerlaeia bacterium]|nr:DUF5703 domain-containing protein [Sumerlaeia bacterium]